VTLHLNTARLIAAISYYATGTTDGYLQRRVLSEVTSSVRQPMKASQFGVHF